MNTDTYFVSTQPARKIGNVAHRAIIDSRTGEIVAWAREHSAQDFAAKLSRED